MEDLLRLGTGRKESLSQPLAANGDGSSGLSPCDGRTSVPPVSGVREWTPLVSHTRCPEVGATFLPALVRAAHPSY